MTRNHQLRKISKPSPVKIEGDLRISEGLEYALDQKIKEVQVVGDFQQDNITVDLGKLERAQQAGAIEISVGDLELPEGATIVSDQASDVVLRITASTKKDDATSDADEEVIKDDSADEKKTSNEKDDLTDEQQKKDASSANASGSAP